MEIVIKIALNQNWSVMEIVMRKMIHQNVMKMVKTVSQVSFRYL